MRVVVLGGGITGLAAAHRLVRLARDRSLDLEVSLLEASPRTGGVIASRRDGAFLLEEGPDCFISNKPAGVALCEELGLESQLIPTAGAHRRSFIVKHGRLLPVPEGLYLMAPTKVWPFLLSPLISLTGKLRMGWEWFVPPAPANGDESLESFVTRRFGSEALTWVAQPMIGGIYTADPARLSLRATFPQFLDMEAKYGSVLRGMLRSTGVTAHTARGAAGPRYGLFLSFKDGMATLVSTLAARVGPSRIRTGVEVTSITRDPGGWTLTTVEHGPIQADGVCVALPAGGAAAVLEGALPAVSRELREIPYGGAATLNLVFDRDQVQHPLDGMGFVVPAAEKLSLIGCTFSNVKFEGRAPDGRALLRAFVGGDASRDLLREEDPVVMNRVLGDLRRLLGIQGDPAEWRLTRHAIGLPQYPPGHLDRVARIEAAQQGERGLALAGNGYRGVGIPDCVQSAERAVAKLMDDLFPASAG